MSAKTRHVGVVSMRPQCGRGLDRVTVRRANRSGEQSLKQLVNSPIEAAVAGGKIGQNKRRWERMRVRLFIRQFGLCYWCGSPMSLQRKHAKGNASIYCTFEHLIPRRDGGRWRMDNLVGAHGKCNSGREANPEKKARRKKRRQQQFSELIKELEFTV